MTNFVQKFLFVNLPMRGAFVDLTESVQTILSQKEYPDGVRQFLGELITANVLISSNIKFDGKLIIQVNDNPKVDLIVSECTDDLKIRATAKFDKTLHNDNQVSYQDCSRHGVLVISAVMKNAKTRYQSLVPLESNDLASALEEYMLQSEQLKSLFILVYTEKRVVGFMLQQLPDHAMLHTQAIELLFTQARTVKPKELLNTELQELLKNIFSDEDLILFDREEVKFACTCSLERVSTMLRSLGKEEAQNIIAERGNIEVTCDFCNTHYHFSANDIKNMFDVICMNIESISNTIN